MTRIEKIRENIRREKIDAMLLISEPGRYYATGFAASDGVALITDSEAYFFTDSRYIEAANDQITGFCISQNDLKHPMTTLINEVLEEQKISTLGFEDGYMTYNTYICFKTKLNAELVPAQNVINTLREVKDEWEIKQIIAAQRIAEKAFDELLGVITPDMTEKQVAAELIYKMRLLGADDVSFDPIVVTGANSSKPHGVPGHNKLERGTFTTIDFGCKLNGFCSDETRTIAFGSVSGEMRKVYETVLEAQLAGIAQAKGGVIGAEVDRAARAVITRAGYGEYFGHSFGHGVGLEIHEAPNASPAWNEKLQAGNVISAEPGIYLPGQFGVRIEDVIILTETGCIDITKTEKSLIIL